MILDVSNVNPISWRELRIAKRMKTGVPVLIAKCTEGSTFVDDEYGRHRSLAVRESIIFGAYLFLRVGSSGDEARFFLEHARLQAGDLQPIVDAEDTSRGISALADRSIACLVALERAGYRPILYASSSTWQAMIRYQPQLRRFRVWEAQYPGRFTRWMPRLAKLRVRLRHGVTVVMWQWTSSYVVDGRRFDASRLLCRPATIRIGGR